MISIPVSFLLVAIFTALGFWIAIKSDLPPLARKIFSGLFLLLAVETLLVGLRFVYGWTDLIALQRVLPVWIGPGVYLGFKALIEAQAQIRRTALFHGAVACVASALLTIPGPAAVLADGIIAVSFAFYTGALIWLWRLGPDVFAQARTSLGLLLHRLALFSAALLAATFLLDGGVAVLYALNRPEAAVQLISVAGLVVMVVVLAALAWFAFRTQNRKDGIQQEKDQANRVRLVEQAQSVLSDQNLYKDPGLTLTRLARRVGVPDRDLSRAINQVADCSVSQFVNQFRLEEAARLLRTTSDPVSQIQEQSGFMTRSNFYKEFQRRYGQSPGLYRQSGQESSDKVFK